MLLPSFGSAVLYGLAVDKGLVIGSHHTHGSGLPSQWMAVLYHSVIDFASYVGFGNFCLIGHDSLLITRSFKYFDLIIAYKMLTLSLPNFSCACFRQMTCDCPAPRTLHFHQPFTWKFVCAVFCYIFFQTAE